MIRKKNMWNVLLQDEQEVQRISSENGISSILARVLINRGIRENEEIKRFLFPNIIEMHSPFLLKDMNKAVERILSEINKKGRILIYGDYDADGVTSTSVLYSYLRSLEADVEYYIPDRVTDGYGLNIDTLKVLCKERWSLIITVDNGIAAQKEIEFLSSQGIDTIITDHHECGEILPEAYAIINPKRHDCEYPYKHLAGAGVALKLVLALAERNGDDYSDIFQKYLGLVCIGTVADIVPLTGENRIIVKYGANAVQNGKNIGITALCDEANVQKINTWSIGFMLAPRINAAGRMGEAKRAVELFTTTDTEKAQYIASELTMENKNRQGIEAKLFEDILQKIFNEKLNERDIIIVSGEDWHHGVLGIVASRVTERFCKPCIVISFDGETGKGSGRSIEGINLFQVLGSCSQYLEKYGGHELAGGVTIAKNNLLAFEKEAQGIVKAINEKTVIKKSMTIECRISPDELNLKNIENMELLEPIGMENPSPLFCMNKLKVENIRAISEGKHLKLILSRNGSRLDAVCFQMGELGKHFKAGDYIDAVFSAEKNTYMKKESVQLIVKDICSNIESILERKYFETFDMDMFPNESGNTLNSSMFNYGTRDWNFISGLINSKRKNLFLINTLEVGRELIAMLSDNSDKLLNEFEVKFDFDSEALPDNLLWINPNLENLNAQFYDNVILCDAFFKSCYYDTIIDKCRNNKIYIIYSEDDIKYNLNVIKTVEINRGHMEAVYKFARKYCSSNSQGVLQEEIEALLEKESGRNINSFIFKKSLQIFGELNLLKSSFDGQKWKIVSVYAGNEKVKLEDSSQYRKVSNCLEDFNIFAEKIIKRTFKE